MTEINVSTIGSDAFLMRAASLLRSLAQHFPDVQIETAQLILSLSQAYLRFEGFEEETLRPHGLSRSKLFVLLWLRAAQEEGHDGLTPSALSDQLHVSRGTASTLIGGLETQGYVTRVLDLEDKRRFVIRLTPEGDRVGQSCAALLLQRMQSVIDQLGPSTSRELIDTLVKLRDILQRSPHG